MRARAASRVRAHGSVHPLARRPAVAVIGPIWLDLSTSARDDGARDGPPRRPRCPWPHPRHHRPDGAGPAPRRGADHPLLRLRPDGAESARSEEHTSEIQSLMRISYAVFCLKKNTTTTHTPITTTP